MTWHSRFREKIAKKLNELKEPKGKEVEEILEKMLLNVELKGKRIRREIHRGREYPLLIELYDYKKFPSYII